MCFQFEMSGQNIKKEIDLDISKNYLIDSKTSCAHENI